jgi:periplasmic protein CpxP/Spy
MTRKTVLVAWLAAAIGAAPLMAQGMGQGRGRGGPGGPGGPPGMFPMLRQLDLSDAQQQQLRTIMQDERGPADQAGQVRSAEQKLHAALLADTPDLQAIETLKAALNSAHAAELDHRIETMQKVAQILTPAQRQKLIQLEAEAPAWGGRGRGPGR